MTASGTSDFAFTEYIRSLDPDGEPEPSAFDAAWQKLHRILWSELRRRFLSTSPPTYLGVIGYASWREPGALEELIQDGFREILVERLAYLTGLLAVRSHIEDIAYTLIRNFVHERQKKSNPLGFRIYEDLRDAMRRLNRDHALHVLDGDPRMRNGTILGFAPETDPKEAEHTDVAEHVATWCDHLLPDLLTAARRQVDALCRHVLELGNHCRAFRFGDVHRALERAVRERWSVFLEEDEGGLADGGDGGDFVRRIRPEPGYEERRQFAELLDCVDESLPGRAKDDQTLEYLRRLWAFVRLWLAEEDRWPSERQLERLIQVPRRRVRGLLKLLRDLVDECRGNGATVR